jgi:lysophospholipase L1-like esterase
MNINSLAFPLCVILLFSVCARPAAAADLAASPRGGTAPRTAASLASGEKSVTIVCFGDSVTGLYYHTGGRRAYADMLELAMERLYPKAAVTVVNAGISGHTTVDALKRMDADVLAHKPDLVTIMFGLNDMTRVSLDDYRANLATIIARCREIGAEVLLCTPNAVLETANRPSTTLVKYVEAVRAVGAEQKTPVVDCYRAYDEVRTKDPLAFALLMSDEIHPNMDGHKLFAELLAEAVSGKAISLADVGPMQPAIPKTLALISAGKPVNVYAMPPYDQHMAAALRQLVPSATVKVTPWPVSGKSLAEIEQHAKEVRKMTIDLVVIAVPPDADADTVESYIRSYSWVLNWSLSFGYQEWDCIALPPSVTTPKLSTDVEERDRIARKLIGAQDLGTVTRQDGDDRPAEALLLEWLREQATSAETKP